MELPDEIRCHLFMTLFSRVSSLAVVLVAALVVGAAEIVRNGSRIAAAASLLDVLLLSLRCLLILRYRQQDRAAPIHDPGPWIVRFGVTAIGSSACWGVMTFSSLVFSHDPVLYLLPVVSTCGTAGAIAARNSAFPRIALAQIAVSLGLTMLGAGFTDDSGNALLLVLVPLLFAGLRAVVVERNQQLVSLMLAQDELRRLAGTDALTGLGNRRRFDEALADFWRGGRRAGTDLSLLLVDVDRFKRYNDLYGHQPGDRVLVAIAAELQAVTQRAGDLAARQGGEEFAVLLPGTDRPGAVALAERLRARVEALDIAHAGSAEGRITVSIGVACLRPAAAGPGVEQLFEQADRALYRAKDLGRNRVESAPPDAGPP